MRNTPISFAQGFDILLSFTEVGHSCLVTCTLFKIRGPPPELVYMCVNSTKRRYSDNQYKEITNFWGIGFN